MPTTVLVLNAGSSSLKFALFDIEHNQLMLEGIAERLATPQACVKANVLVPSEIGEISEKESMHQSIKGAHDAALSVILEWLSSYRAPAIIGHRVVHGGELFRAPVIIDADVLTQIEQCSEFAPLHNPANILGIKAAMAAFKQVPQAAVFDTAFHSTLPAHAFMYALPMALYQEEGIRRYGFHGTSHQYVNQKTADYMQASVENLNMVVAHLGNGCSATAIAGGKSVDTTMGLTPLEGLVMGTRSGSLDPAILLYLAHHKNWSLEKIDAMLNKESGLLGLSALSNDMRTLEAAKAEGHEGAALAIDVFCFRLAKAISSLSVSLPSLDALVFTGGIGENSTLIREQTVAHLHLLGLRLNRDRNSLLAQKQAGLVSDDRSVADIWVVPTNEELMIAQQTFSLLP